MSENDVCTACSHYRRDHSGPGGMCRWERGTYACKCGRFHESHERGAVVL